MSEKSKADQYRVIGRWLNRPQPRGYIGREWVKLNVLQKRKTLFFGLVSFWSDVEIEEVPSHVEISLACHGDAGSDWRSKFHHLIKIQREASHEQ